MFVDIGPRRSGKTTRMVNSIVNYLSNNPDKTAIVVSPNNSSRVQIVSKVIDKCGDLCRGRCISSYRMINIGLKSSKHFVDEFTKINEKDLLLDKEAYYCGLYDVGTTNDLAKLIINYYETFKYNNTLKPNSFVLKHNFKNG